LFHLRRREVTAMGLLGEVFEDVTLVPVSVRDRTYEALKQAIVRGRLAPGQRIVEAQVAELLNISRTPLREALLRLEAEGFVERVTSGGVRVRGLSLEEIRELYAVRSVLEGLTAREATERITNEQLESLANLIRQIEEADSGASPDVHRIARLGEEFHQIILEASGNRKCADLLRLLQDHIDRYRQFTIAMPGRGRAAAKEHEALLEALRLRDPEKAERAMRAHVLEAGQWLTRRLREANREGGKLNTRRAVPSVGRT